MKNTFKNFSGQDYMQGACITLKNAQGHLSASEVLFNTDHIGIAVSHLILGAEEYIKAFILLCLHGDNNFISNDDKIELFRNHNFKHRHLSLFLNAISNSAAAKFEDEIFDRFINKTPPPSIYSVDGLYINTVFQLVRLEDARLLKAETWLNKANELKNNGFYVGVKEDWTSPEVFSEKDYYEAKDCTQIIHDAISPLFELPISDDDLIQYLNREFILG